MEEKQEKKNKCRIILIACDENIEKLQIFNIQVSWDVSVTGISKSNLN